VRSFLIFVCYTTTSWEELREKSRSHCCVYFMRHYKHKRGVNEGYVSRVESKAAEDKANGVIHPKYDKKKNLFRGLLGGNTFTTSMGTKVSVLDSMWGQNIFLSFNNDEVEVLNIALRSSLADVTEQVIGGEYGSPYQLGDFGFYAENRLQGQTDLLEGLERKYAVGKYFLSAAEWEKVDAKLHDIGFYSYPAVRRAVRGDTFASLALRANAFKVAKVLMDLGVDPLLENDDGEDLVCILREQYGYMSDRLHHIIAHKDETQRRVFAPSELAEVLSEEKYVIDTFSNMKGFIDSTVANLQRRLVLIHRDKQDKRRADLRNETLEPWKLWNSQQEEKANKHVSECAEIQAFIDEKVLMYSKHSNAHVTMAERVAMQHALTIGVAEGKEIDHEAHALIQAKLDYALEESSGGTPGGAVSSQSLYELMGVGQDMSSEASVKKPSEAKAMEDDAPTFAEVVGVLREIELKGGGKEVILYR